MKSMHRILCVSFLLSSFPAFAKEKKEELLPILQSLEGEAQGNLGLFHVKFNKKISYENLAMESHGTFLQLALPNTMVANPGSFQDSKSPYVEKIASFQLDGQNSAVRFFVGKSADVIKKHMKVDVLVDRLLITIDHQGLDQEFKNLEAVPSASDIVAKTKVETGIEAPAKRIKKEKNKKPADEEKTNLASQFIKEKLNKIAMFSLIFLGGMVVLAALKPILRRRRSQKYADTVEAIKIKTLATHNLAPKQKLALIQVGREQILLGLTPDNINLIKTISSPPTATLPAATYKPVAPKKITAPIAKAQAVREPLVENDVKEIKTPPPPARKLAKEKPQATQAINDVTKLIREKLKNLPAI